MTRSFTLEDPDEGHQPVRYPIAVSLAIVVTGGVAAVALALPPGVLLRALLIGAIARAVQMMGSKTAAYFAVLIAAGGMTPLWYRVSLRGSDRV